MISPRPHITSLGFYYNVVQKYIFAEAWVFPADIPFFSLLAMYIFTLFKNNSNWKLFISSLKIWVIGSQIDFTVEKWSSFLNFNF